MPEGDTIFRAARTLHRALSGATVTRFETVFPTLSRVDDGRPLVGRTIERVNALGKNVMMQFSGDLILRTHMRMNGSWHIYRPGERWQRAVSALRVLVGTADFVAVGFDVPVAEFLTSRALARHPWLSRLGPDLLADTFDEDEAVRRLRVRSGEAIADALLDQAVVAGAGNVFKSETLFLCRTHPWTPVDELSDTGLREIVRTARRLLGANVGATGEGRIVTYAGLRRTTRGVDPAASLWVYGRRGAPCRTCGTPIRVGKRGPAARTTFWCPVCQPARAAPAGGTATATSGASTVRT